MLNLNINNIDIQQTKFKYSYIISTKTYYFNATLRPLDAQKTAYKPLQDL